MQKNTILNSASMAYRKASISLFGNVAGIKVNFLYILYCALIKICQFRIGSPILKSSHDAAHIAKIVKLEGFSRVNPSGSEQELSILAKKVDALFNDESKVVHTLEDGGLIRLKSCLLELPELSEFIFNEQVSSILYEYFSSGYKIYSCDVYRTIPRSHNNPEEKFPSLKWHFDNCPSPLLKVMIYFGSTTRDNGALTLVPKNISLDLKRKGFWDRNLASKFLPRIEENAQVLEGAAGTTLIFSAHHCIHKATLPLKGHRDVAVFLLHPSLSIQKELSSQEARDASYSYGYCVNPFLGTPMRYGDE